MDFTRQNALLDSGAWAELSPAAGKVLMVLEFRASSKDGKCWPSLAGLARDAGLSPNTTKRGLREIEAAGLFKVLDKGPEVNGRPRYSFERMPVQPRQSLIGSKDNNPVKRQHRPCQTAIKTPSKFDTESEINQRMNQEIEKPTHVGESLEANFCHSVTANQPRETRQESKEKMDKFFAFITDPKKMSRRGTGPTPIGDILKDMGLR